MTSAGYYWVWVEGAWRMAYYPGTGRFLRHADALYGIYRGLQYIGPLQPPAKADVHIVA